MFPRRQATKMLVSEIVILGGFENNRSFIRLINKTFKQTPVSYRRIKVDERKEFGLSGEVTPGLSHSNNIFIKQNYRLIDGKLIRSRLIPTLLRFR